MKATYTLEGDGALVFGCFDVLASLAVGIRTAHFLILLLSLLGFQQVTLPDLNNLSSMDASVSNWVLTTFSPSSIAISVTVLLPLKQLACSFHKR